MKNLTKYTCLILGLALMASCKSIDYPDRFVQTSGIPKVDFVRYADKDVIITQANMEEVVCIVGDNLTSVHDLYFNDQKAVLNSSYMTAKTLLVAVPKNMPAEQTDKMYLITKDSTVVAYDFKVLPPAPKISSMSLEWAQPGETVTIYGSYLFPPMTVEFPGVDPVNATTSDGSFVTVTVPEGAQPGKVKVSNDSGTAQSVFMYKDSRGMILDWDGIYGRESGNGWRAVNEWSNGNIKHAPGDDAFPAICGNYIVFTKEFDGTPTGAWAEDECSFDYWAGEVGSDAPPVYAFDGVANLLATNPLSNLALKFEVLIPSSNPWTCVGMQLMFSSEKYVSASNANNNYFSDETFPRYVWEPWVATGSYDTADKWVTVSFPLSSFNKKADGSPCSTTFNESFLHGLSFFVWNGSQEGTAGTPVIAIDNIRIAPIN